jgi:hypothetical protein
MEKNLKIKLTKKILIQFLKKEKALGIMYVYGYSKCGSLVSYNIMRINITINSIENTFSEGAIKEKLKSIIGGLYTPNDLIFPIKMKKNTLDGLYTIYLNWCNYINKNWTEIYESYKKLNTIHKKKC